MTVRVVILAIFIVAYLAWAAAYLLPSPRAEVLSDANLRRVFGTANFTKD
jgi:hypothetical protein